MTTAVALPTNTNTVHTAAKAILKELQHQFLELDDQIEGWVLAVLCRENVLGYGEVGTAKSDVAHAFAARIINAKYAWWLMDRQMDKAELLGMMSLPIYTATGAYERVITNTLFDADFAFFDEADKCGPAVKTPVLTAINEHKGKTGTEWIDLPLISSFAACNADLEAGDEAFSDRFLVKLVFERIKGNDNFIALLESMCVSRATVNPTTLTRDELMHAIEVEIPAVVVPRAVYVSMLALRDELVANQILPSNRRWKKCVRLLQAKAWLEGRDTVDEDDLIVLRHALWDDRDLRQKVGRIVVSHTGPVTRTAIKILQAIREKQVEIDKMVSADEGLETRAAAGGRLQGDIKELTNQIKRARTDAANNGRSAERLDEVDEALKELHISIFVNCMNMPPEGARRMAAV